MHQPYYTDPVTRAVSMPWVRLHATKAYFDMAFALERCPGVNVSVNFTPSLVLQLQEMTSGSVHDLFLEHAERLATDLTPAERAFVVRHFFSANWATMVRPYPRYHELLVKRGTDVRASELDRVSRQFTTQDLLDLQVWHNLAWFGFGAVARHPTLAELRAKNRGFTEGDKQHVLELQRATLVDIIPSYRRLAEAGQVELTTSPFFHPILPLVIDTDVSRRARPDLPLPARYQAPADAEWHLCSAVAHHAAAFGSAPKGLWPSEGSVCPELVPLVTRAGLEWMATDEGVLARSLGHWDRDRDLYHPYVVGEPGEDVAILFRDRELSDAIGFVYSKNTPESATDNFLGRLADIADRASGPDPMAAVILDGENPWEHYYDGGERFLSGIYAGLSPGSRRHRDLHASTMTVSRYLEAYPPRQGLQHLHSGSWINQDFKIWLGHPEDNRAWELLRETRSRLVEATPTLSPDQRREAWSALYAAEGSDWFWWYGDDFETDYKSEFDRLFRTHLRNALQRAGVTPPDFLNDPIVAVREPDRSRLPVDLLLPTIDGLVTDFFEWHGAGTIDVSPPLGAMWKPNRFFAGIAFGYSLDALFIRLDPDPHADASSHRVEVHVSVPGREHRLIFPLGASSLESFLRYSAQTGSIPALAGEHRTICRRKVIELAVAFKDLGLHAGLEFKLSVLVSQNGLEVERYPRYHPLTLTVPDENFRAVMWKV
jgi:alpha-amylase/alpha-mannosidase (GH57 family)